MELRHLRTVVAVARHGSFTKAGEELFMAQSAISQQVRKLETELGIQLFRRGARRVEVTLEGQVVLEHAHRVLAEVNGLKEELEELTGLLRGKVAIGAMYPTGPYDLPGVLAEYHAAHPGVGIHLLEETQEAMLQLLQRDELHLAFVSIDPAELGEEFAATLLWEDHLVVTMAPDHPFAAQDHVTLDQLAGETLVAYRENSAIRRRLEAALGEREPRNAFVCTEMSAVRQFAGRGLGVAVLPRTIAEAPGPEIAFRPIGPEPLTWPVSLVWCASRRQPPAAKAFIAAALAAAEAMAPPALTLAA